jgi:hypothetical protein
MSDDTDTDVTDLFGSDDSEQNADSNSTEDTAPEEASNGEGSESESQQELATAKGELNRQKQIDVWTARVKSGEADINALPKDLQWLKAPISKRLDSEKAPDIEKVIERKLQEKEEAKQYDTLKSQMQKMKLGKTQKDIISAEFKDLLSSGLPRHKALEKALKIADVDIDNADKEIARGRMRLPTGGRLEVEVPFEDGNLKSMPEKKRLELYRQMERGE